MNTTLLEFHQNVIKSIVCEHKKKSKKKINLKNNKRYKEEISMLIEEESDVTCHKIFRFEISDCIPHNDIIINCSETSVFILSHYNADGLLQMLIDINNDAVHDCIYVVCVGYKDILGGDVQIGFSGSEKKHSNETPVDILQRECTEEIGNINCIDCITHVGATITLGSKAHTTIAVNLDEPSKLSMKHKYKCQITFDESSIGTKQQRVNGVLYGNLKNTLHVINSRGGSRPVKSRDNIDKLFVVPIKTAIDMVTSLRASFEGNTIWYLDDKLLKWKKN